MKHILILTLLLPVICLGQKDNNMLICNKDSISVWSLAPHKPIFTQDIAPPIGATWRIADTIYTVNRNNEFEKYVRLKDSCEHIWVMEYGTPALGLVHTDIVCIKCYKREKISESTPQWPYPDPQMNQPFFDDSLNLKRLLQVRDN